MHQLYTNEIPLGHVDPGEFTHLVVGNGLRPERSYEDEAPQLTGPVWDLAERCWDQSATARPNADAVCDVISNLLDTVIRTRLLPETPVPNSSDPSVLSTSLHCSLPPVPLPTNSLLRLVGHTDLVRSGTFLSDGHRIASGSNDKTFRVWDARTGKEVIHSVPQAEAVRSVRFSPDGKRIVTLGKNTMRVWHATTGQIAAGPFQQRIRGWDAIFSPDTTQVVYGASDNTIRIINALTGNLVCEPLKGHSAPVYSVAFSSGGKRIASGSADNTVRVWDARTQKVKTGPFGGHTDDVYSVAFSPDGRSIVSGSLDKTIIVWDARTARVGRGPLNGHTDWVRSVAFSPDGTNTVSCSGDKTIRIWDAKDGSLVVPPLTWHTQYVKAVAFSPDGERILSCSDNSVIVGQWKAF